MIVTSGRVIDGKIVVEGARLPEGEAVTVIARDAGEELELTPEQEQFLLQSAEQARSGRVISCDELLGRISPR